MHRLLGLFAVVALSGCASLPPADRANCATI
jgi:hypothetical protein